jgi:hypothetical protein
MENSKRKIDIVNEVLEACILAYPVSSFVISLYKQYQLRGSLSKKQLQGLYQKAEKIKDLPPGKLAGLEALIKKMPTRYKSDLPAPASALPEKDEHLLQQMDAILEKYPSHKRVLFLKSKYENDEALSPQEITDLNRIEELLRKKETH